MEYLSYKAKNNVNLKDKPKIYFTSTKSDKEKYLEEVAKDIFDLADAIIYFKNDMDHVIEDDYLETDLSYMKLFAIPVTKELLESDSEAFDKEYQFAIRHHIPVLLIAFDQDLGYRYGEKFNTLQYLSKCSNDETEIDYRDKLKKYLDRLIQRDQDYDVEAIRASFTSKAFLSYRKKDRNHANQLMKAIHKDRTFVSSAIWFDEFLSVGEKFDQEIEDRLDESDYFILMITPNLINEENYVKNVEYPHALKVRKTIIPIVVQDTDMEELHKQFPHLPPCLDARDADFLEKLKALIPARGRELTTKNKYRLAEAYIHGVDVEINSELGISLLEEVALAKDGEFDMVANYVLSIDYEFGFGVEIDYQKSYQYAEKYYQIAKGRNDEKNVIFMAAANLADSYLNLGKYDEAIQLANELKSEISLTDKQSLILLVSIYDSLAKAFAKQRKYEEAIQACQDCYALSKTLFGEMDSKTLSSVVLIAECYEALKEYEKASGVFRDLIRIYQETYGIESQEFLSLYLRYAKLQGEIGNYQEAYEACARAYPAIVKVHGEFHAGVVTCLNILGDVYIAAGDLQQAEQALNGALYVAKKIKEDKSLFIRLYFSLTKLHLEKKDIDKARECTKELADVVLSLYGPAHPMSVETCVQYAKLNPPDTGKEEALKYLDIVYDHIIWGTRDLVIQAAAIYDALGREDQAHELLRRYVQAHPNPNKPE